MAGVAVGVGEVAGVLAADPVPVELLAVELSEEELPEEEPFEEELPQPASKISEPARAQEYERRVIDTRGEPNGRPGPRHADPQGRQSDSE